MSQFSLPKYILPASAPIFIPKRPDTLDSKSHDGFTALSEPRPSLSGIAKPSGSTAERK
jgi:hypothetical protein